MRFETLKEQLLAGGITPWRVRRYLVELEDHLADLTAQETTAGYAPDEAAARARTLLGSEAELAAAWLAQPSLKSLSARAPWLVFGLLPPFAALLAFLVPTLFLVLVAKTHGMIMRGTIAAPDWFQEMAIFVTLASDLLLAPLLAILLLVTAHRQRLNPKWPLIGICVIALFAVHVWVAFPVPGKHGGSIGIGVLPLAGPRGWPMLQSQWLLLLTQFILTFSPLVWLRFAKRPHAA